MRQYTERQPIDENNPPSTPIVYTMLCINNVRWGFFGGFLKKKFFVVVFCFVSLLLLFLIFILSVFLFTNQMVKNDALILKKPLSWSMCWNAFIFSSGVSLRDRNFNQWYFNFSLQLLRIHIGYEMMQISHNFIS